MKKLETAKNVIEEAVKAGECRALYVREEIAKKRDRIIISLAQKKGVRIESLNKEQMIKTAGKPAPIAADIESAASGSTLQSLIKNALENEKLPLIVMLDGVTDVHNFGAIIRSAHFFSAAGIIVGKNNSAPLNDTAYKISAGAAVSIPVVREVNLGRALEKLKEAGFWSYAAMIDGSSKIEESVFDTPSVLILGSEDKGVSEKLAEKADFKVGIEQYSGFDSLNVSASAAVFLYAWRTQRG